MPSKVVSGWVTDQIAPSYWIPNSQIRVTTKIIYILYHYIVLYSPVEAVRLCLVLMTLSITAGHVVEDFVMTAVPSHFLFHGGGGAPLQLECVMIAMPTMEAKALIIV